MPAKQEPNIGINYGWDAGESGINLQLDENWKAIGALLQLSVVSATDNIPTSPAAGDRYIIPTGATGVWSTHVGKVARYNEGAWEIYTPLKGWLAYVQDVDVHVFFDGASWGNLELGDASAVVYNNMSSGLTAENIQSAIDELVVQLGGGSGGSYVRPSVNNQTGTSYTLVLTDDNSVVRCSNASSMSVTIPTNALVAFPIGSIVQIRQVIAGQVTLVAASGVTLNTSETLITRKQGSTVGLMKVGTEEWDVTGDMEAAI